jgi:hypothetical protein
VAGDAVPISLMVYSTTRTPVSAMPWRRCATLSPHIGGVQTTPKGHQLGS